jgi:hypothetical protein
MIPSFGKMSLNYKEILYTYEIRAPNPDSPIRGKPSKKWVFGPL